LTSNGNISLGEIMSQNANNLFNLDGKVAIVTGGASGIGAGIAEVLAESGATVVIADINAEQAEAQATALRDAGYSAGSVRVDMADEESIIAACAEIVSQFGTPWALVNNAGLQDREFLLDSTAAHWDRIQGVNARGPFLMTREVARAMVAVGQGGRIINVSSAALIGSVIHGLTAYTSSKGALLALSRASAFELAEHKITVNTLLPGGVMTNGAMTSTGPMKDTGPALRTPALGDLCEPRDMGAAVLFYASTAARNVTNQVLAVDAGWSLT
jgi:NAD(P)-dependent dehydrogenase (short-subunit alcohol dehydrogenase family)